MVPLPITNRLAMQSESKSKAQDAIRRLEGLTVKLRSMIEEDAYCPAILQLVLAMQGHLKHIQGHVLESHLHTCAEKKLNSKSEKEAFIAELVKVIGLSKR
jgi:DNA-binding FrmR family transcriptional regulator